MKNFNSILMSFLLLTLLNKSIYAVNNKKTQNNLRNNDEKHKNKQSDSSVPVIERLSFPLDKKTREALSWKEVDHLVDRARETKIEFFFKETNQKLLKCFDDNCGCIDNGVPKCDKKLKVNGNDKYLIDRCPPECPKLLICGHFQNKDICNLLDSGKGNGLDGQCFRNGLGGQYCPGGGVGVNAPLFMYGMYGKEGKVLNF